MLNDLLTDRDNFKDSLKKDEIWNGYVGLESIIRKKEIANGKSNLPIVESCEAAQKSKTRVEKCKEIVDVTRKMASKGGREKCSFYNFHQYDEPDNENEKNSEQLEADMTIKSIIDKYTTLADK